MSKTPTVAHHISITGVVQGVGFRPFVYNLAQRYALCGWVLNHSGGVDIEVEGPPEPVAAFGAALRAEAPPLAHITSLDVRAIAPNGYAGFEIRHSERQAGTYQLISPDVAMCPDCARELFDPDDRRYRYPFTNCTNCGPRFTIIQDIPYDRPNTTMGVFPLCDACRAEYENPADRRFHAQPNACPVCGPQLWLVENQQISKSANQRIGESKNYESRITNYKWNNQHPATSNQHPATSIQQTTEYTLSRAKELLLSGKILAIKGLGGFQLACDATNVDAVQLLRERKRRPHKPFAIMAATLEDVKAICDVPAEAEALMTSPQCPIVLLERRSTLNGQRSIVADNVAPNQHTLGVMLPYTPLHHILLRDVGLPLVMTSGNLSEEPIAKDNDEALERLAPLADAFLLHNRDIYARYDDSVVQVVNYEGDRMSRRIMNYESANRRINEVPHNPKPTPHNQFLRRARGYAPFPIHLPFKTRQIFAAGPLLKNTFTLTRDEYAFVSQHIGDMENLETLEHYEAALATYTHLFRLEPEAVVCDMHPDYLTTRFAVQYAREHNLPEPLRVQHHKAHIAACLADNGWAASAGAADAGSAQRVIGVALDGTGHGEDGAIWGGEWFVGNYGGFERVAHLEYLPLPGGDAAIREPWRIAWAYLYELFGEEGFPAGMFCPSDAMMLREQVKRRINTAPTSSMGRLFDAVSALLDVCHKTTYEAQAAIELEQIATMPSGAISPYPFDVDTVNGKHIVRLAALFDALLADVETGQATGEIAWRFHATVAQMIVWVCERIRAETGIAVVALSGGVFQNRLLMQLAIPQLQHAGLEVLLHQHVPCNDGGVSLGQAVLAAEAALKK